MLQFVYSSDIVCGIFVEIVVCYTNAMIEHWPAR